MRRVFATLCLAASVAFIGVGCGGEDPEVTKNNTLIIEVIKLGNEQSELLKDPAKNAAKLAEGGPKYVEKMQKFQALPAPVKEKLIAKNKAEWEKFEKNMKSAGK